ncbi:UNKNOWN [Stylonychia lemnae]|uniref:GPS domain-containing protein n=1 Tax=Stylonychia lemnae TaxID=5949 RepID=A0A078A1P4_STYLE|nr:UNKNOWN [Stylonychia lemnae]|eukprot:CDW76030.1 UNKNOWN [Stylonychia lemnae]
MLLTILIPTEARQASTSVFDGVMNNYNTYLRFGGQSGLQVKDYLQALDSYSLSVWIRLQVNPTDYGKNMDILTLKPGFQCYFNIRSRILCQPDVSSSPSYYQIDAGIRLFNWYIITIRSSQTDSIIQLRELQNVVFSQEKYSIFFPFGYSQISVQETYLGIDKDSRSDGFVGNIRNFKLFSAYYTDAQLWNAQFIYIIPNSQLIMQVLLNDLNDFKNDADFAVGTIVGNQKQLPREIDYRGNFWCWFPQENVLIDFLQFSPSFSLSTYNIPSGLLDTSKNFDTTLQVWFKRSNEIQFSDLSNDESLFEHTNVLRARFLLSNYYNLRIDPLTYQNYDISLENIGVNKWYYLQVQTSTNSQKSQIYDSDGNMISQVDNSFPTLKSSSRTILIGRNFNGYIQGIKYFKTQNPSNSGGPFAMKNSTESSTDCLMYFIFWSYAANGGTFTNYANSARTQTIDSSDQITYKKQYYKEYGSSNAIGTVNQADSFDGYTCRDNREKLLMVNQLSYVSSNFVLSNELRTYTVEFWIKPTAQISTQSFMFALQDNIFQQLYTVIAQESSGDLFCYPIYTKNSTLSVKYLDYKSDKKSWMHISCIVNANTQIVQGVLFDMDSDYVYYQLQNIAIQLPKYEYYIYLNRNPAIQSAGISNAYYSELRFWSYARTTQQIKDFQFHQLNVINDRPSLLAYFKLFTGQAVNQGFELNYADSALTKAISLNNIKWQSETSLTVCPLGMYKSSYTDSNCYREGILRAQAFVIRNATHFIVSPFYTIYRNNLLRDEATNYFNFSWNLDRMNVQNITNQNIFPGFFNPQKNNFELVFHQDQVSNSPGKYDITLTIQDKERAMEQQQISLTLKTQKCLNIFDKVSKQSLVYKDMDSRRSIDNAVFQYEFSQCGSYVFDKNSLTIDIDFSDKITLLNSDHDKNLQQFTLRSTQQRYLPLNEYFYIRIKGVWRNQNDNSDTIEYYLIYACRYISKLVLKLKPNYYTVLKGQQLVIDYTGEYYNIADSVAGERTYTLQWQCPGALNNICRSQSSQLVINYDLYSNNKLPFWTGQTLTLTATTNFIQGDGTKTSSTSVQISWLDVNPDATQAVASRLINKEQRVALQMNINNMPEEKLQIRWDVTPSVNTKCYLNEANRKQFVLNSSCVNEGTTYNVTGNIVYVEQQQIIWQRFDLVTVPVSPKSGSISCNRTSGRAYIDILSCQTNGWNVPSSPARYQFFIADFKNDSILLPISALTTANNFISALPPTRRIVVKVIDNNQGIGYANLGVTLTYTYDASIVTRAQQLFESSQKVQSTNVIQSQQSLLVLAEILNQTSYQNIVNSTIDFQDYLNKSASLLLSHAKNIKTYSDEQSRRSVIQLAVTIVSTLTFNPKLFNKTAVNVMIDSLTLIFNGDFKDSQEHLLYDSSFNQQLFSVFENVFTALKSLLDQGVITTSLMDKPPMKDASLANLTIKCRSILGDYEQFVASKIYENEEFYYNNSAFFFQVQKFSRMANQQKDQIKQYADGSYTSYVYPLSDATQPTSRQSFSVINFKLSPFIGDYYLNQSATSKSSVYFSYRDEKGNYLSAENIVRDIKITYKYEYSPFVFLPNVTTCGYIQTGDAYWENKSCSVEFSRKNGSINCYCKHMSYYSIIDDYLVRPQKIPLVYLTFRNWTSFIVFLYVILLFVVGTIYTFNKDNQDFRYLHEQEEDQGNTLQSDDSVSLISLTFKRKVFYMMFANTDKMRMLNLLKIYLMLLHPVFQLKYRLDPETPRFYRFLLLFTRIMILFALSFFILKDVKNFNELSGESDFGIVVLQIIILIFLGSFLLVPMPIFLLFCCRSRYLLLDPKGVSRQASDDDGFNDANGVRDLSIFQGAPDRVTKIMIDTSIPIRLLFIINAIKNEDIIKDQEVKYPYISGDVNEVGKKLAELDPFIEKEKEIKSTDDNKDAKTNVVIDQSSKRDKTDSKDLNDIESHTQSNLRQLSGLKSGREGAKANRADKYKTDVNISERENIQEPDSNRPLKFTNNKSKHKRLDQSNNKTEQNILDPYNLDILEIQDQEDDVENLDDDYNDKERIRQFMNEGGEEEELEFSPKNRNSKVGADKQKGKSNNPQDKTQEKSQQARQQQEEAQNEDDASDQDSIDTQLFTDDKKELIEEKNYVGIIFGNAIALIINVGLFISILAVFISGEYYDMRNQYVWVIVFFGAQLFSFFVSDIFVLWIMASTVSGCLKYKKTCLAKWMRESLYIYEDYRYVIQFANTRIT